MPADTERQHRTREALRAAGLDALVCRLAENVVLLSGYYPMVGASVVVFPAEGEPVLIAPRGSHSIEAPGVRRWRGREGSEPEAAKRLSPHRSR